MVGNVPLAITSTKISFVLTVSVSFGEQNWPTHCPSDTLSMGGNGWPEDGPENFLKYYAYGGSSTYSTRRSSSWIGILLTTERSIVRPPHRPNHTVGQIIPQNLSESHIRMLGRFLRPFRCTVCTHYYHFDT